MSSAMPCTLWVVVLQGTSKPRPALQLARRWRPLQVCHEPLFAVLCSEVPEIRCHRAEPLDLTNLACGGHSCIHSCLLESSEYGIAPSKLSCTLFGENG